jgi:hypothetical protein
MVASSTAAAIAKPEYLYPGAHPPSGFFIRKRPLLKPSLRARILWFCSRNIPKKLRRPRSLAVMALLAFLQSKIEIPFNITHSCSCHANAVRFMC